LSTQVHLICDSHGNPLDVVLTGGQTHDGTQSCTLLVGRSAVAVPADKGYDDNRTRSTIQELGAEVVIPSRPCRKVPIDPDAFPQQQTAEVFYEGERVGHDKADLIVEGRVIVEVKAIRGLSEIDFAQGLNGLRATGLPTCLLINFGKAKIEVRRLGMKPGKGPGPWISKSKTSNSTCSAPSRRRPC